MNDNETPQHSTAQEAMYAEMAAMDNQDEPLENYSDRLVGALYRAGFAIIPVVLPADALGEAAVSGAASTGNPKHLWDFLILRVMVKPLPSDAVICKNEKTESDAALMLRVAKEEIKRQAAEIERLKARLEVSPEHPYDGIYCRDATIKLQDERIAELREQEPVNARLLAIAHRTAGLIENTSIETGYCCCGDGMNGHASPMACGHSATDQGEYLAGLLYEDVKSAIAAAQAQQAKPSSPPDKAASELQADAARYRYIRTHRIGVKWCELYAGGPALDEAIDATMAAGQGGAGTKSIHANIKE